MLTLTTAEAFDRARGLVTGTSRVILGITGEPGVGKSTFAAALAKGIPHCVVLGMDGFHLAQSVLVARGWNSRKGALHTFDADGYVATLERIREGGDRTVWAPEFRRSIEDAIAGAVSIEPEAQLVVTEGNYLLVDEDPWNQVPGLCDEVWYLELPRAVRRARLTARHVGYGRTESEAWERTDGSDGTNATLVARTRERADAVVQYRLRRDGSFPSAGPAQG